MAGSRNLHRVLGVAFGLAVSLGVTIGVGILRRPGAVAGALGETWLILLLWTIGGLYALLGALCVAELATTIPEAGGFFIWSRRAIGPWAGFAIGWCDFLANTANIAYAAITIAELLATMVPSLGGNPTFAASGFVLLFGGLQALGIHSGSRTQKVTSALLAGSYLALVGAAFVMGQRAEETVPFVPRAFPLGLFGAIVFAIQSIVVTYDGWYQPAYFAEEMKEPSVDLPRAMVSGVLTVIAVYLLVNTALLYALPMHRLAASEFPASDLAEALFAGSGQRVISILALLALPPSINAALMSGSRVLYGLGKQGMFWSGAAGVSQSGTPHIALAMIVVFALALTWSGTFETLLAMAGFFYVVNHCSAFASLFVLRLREPELRRPFRVPGYPWIPGIVLLAALGFLAGVMISDTTNSLRALALLAVCVPAYWVMRKVV
jgi:APA family basic amino acid/polyamine antiporter